MAGASVGPNRSRSSSAVTALDNLPRFSHMTDDQLRTLQALFSRSLWLSYPHMHPGVPERTAPKRDRKQETVLSSPSAASRTFFTCH